MTLFEHLSPAVQDTIVAGLARELERGHELCTTPVGPPDSLIGRSPIPRWDLSCGSVSTECLYFKDAAAIITRAYNLAHLDAVQ